MARRARSLCLHRGDDGMVVEEAPARPVPRCRHGAPSRGVLAAIDSDKVTPRAADAQLVAEVVG